MPCRFCTIPSDREYSSETQLLAVHHGASQDSGQGRQTCRHRAAGSIARFILIVLLMCFVLIKIAFLGQRKDLQAEEGSGRAQSKAQDLILSYRQSCF